MPATGRGAPAGAALLSFALLGPACASAPDLSPDELLSQDRVVRELRPGALGEVRRGRGSAEAAEAAAEEAEALLAAGDPAEALDTVRRALLETPPPEAGERLREIRVRARRAFTRTALARAEVIAAAPLGREGESLRFEVRLRNLSPVPLVVGEPRAGISPSLVRLSVTRTARDIYGNVRSDSWEESHPLPPGEAPPGGSLSVELSVDTGRFREVMPHGFLEYALGGTVLPSGVTFGEVRLHERIPVEEAVVRTFPQRGWEEVAAEPAAHLERGLRDGNPVRVLVAAGCLPPEGRAAAGARLARRLREGPDAGVVMEASVRAALRFLAGDGEGDLWTEERWEARAAGPGGAGE